MTHPEHTPASPDTPAEPTALAPDTAALDPRAARAWTEKMAVSSLDDGRYAVRVEHGQTYVVDLRDRHEHRCSCPDNGYRGERCKHMRRVALEITEGRVPAPGHVAVSCRGCGARSFVRKGALELCGDCRLPPGTAVRGRETGSLLVVVEPTDTPACDVAAEDATADASDGTAIADFDSNADYPRDDPVVWCVYPFSGHADRPIDELERYAFPRSRLTRRDVTDAQRAVVEHSGLHDAPADGSDPAGGPESGGGLDSTGGADLMDTPGGREQIDRSRGVVQTTL